MIGTDALVAILVASTSLITSIGAYLTHIKFFKSLCCTSECTRDNSDNEPSESTHINKKKKKSNQATEAACNS